MAEIEEVCLLVCGMFVLIHSELACMTGSLLTPIRIPLGFHSFDPLSITLMEKWSPQHKLSGKALAILLSASLNLCERIFVFKPMKNVLKSRNGNEHESPLWLRRLKFPIYGGLRLVSWWLASFGDCWYNYKMYMLILFLRVMMTLAFFFPKIVSRQFERWFLVSPRD